MYRMNYNNFSSLRDRIDDKLLSRIAEERKGCHNGCTQAKVQNRNCGCNEPVEENECNYNYDNPDFDFALAMVYSPYQEWQNIYCLEKGFIAGTIFKELDKPFYGQNCGGGDCHE